MNSETQKRVDELRAQKYTIEELCTAIAQMFNDDLKVAQYAHDQGQRDVEEEHLLKFALNWAKFEVQYRTIESCELIETLRPVIDDMSKRAYEYIKQEKDKLGM